MIEDMPLRGLLFIEVCKTLQTCVVTGEIEAAEFTGLLSVCHTLLYDAVECEDIVEQRHMFLKALEGQLGSNRHLLLLYTKLGEISNE